MTQGNYFQFPIALLHFGKPIDKVTAEESANRIKKIIDYCVVERAYILETELDAKVESLASDHKFAPDNYLELPNEQILLLAACSQIGLGKERDYFAITEAPILVWENHAELSEKAANYGKQLCRVRQDIMIDALLGVSQWNWKRLAVLCAIYASIGDKQHRRIVYSQMGTKANGFSSPREQLKYQGDNCRLNDRQIACIVRWLEKRGLFVSHCLKRRMKFYSNRLTKLELQRLLFTNKKPSVGLTIHSISQSTKKRRLI